MAKTFVRRSCPPQWDRTGEVVTVSQLTLTADHAAATVARSVLLAPYRSVAAVRVAVRAWAYVVPVVM